MKLVRRTTKIYILRERKSLKQHGIYVTEYLTKLNKEVFNSVRLKLRDDMESTWTRGEKFFYKTRDGGMHHMMYSNYNDWLNLPWPAGGGRHR